MMKNLHKWAALLMAGLLVCGTFTACDDDDDDEVVNSTEKDDSSTDSSTDTDSSTEGDGSAATDTLAISISPSELSMPAEGGTATVTVTSEVAWTADVYMLDGSEWATLSTNSGSAGSAEITVVATENATGVARSVDFIFAAADGSDDEAHLSITQAAAEDDSSSLTVEPASSKIKIPATGYSEADATEFIVYVKGTSDVPTLTCDNDAFSFPHSESMNASYKDGYDHVYHIVASKNTSDEVRTATLTITIGDYTGTVKIVQANASGSYLAAGYSQITLSNSNLLTLMGSAKIDNLYGTEVTLATGITLEPVSETGCTWYWSQFGNYYFKFDEGAQFAIKGSGIVFDTIEFFNTNAEDSEKLTLSADTGTVTVGEYEEISYRACYPLVWEGDSSNVTFTALSVDDVTPIVRLMRFTYYTAE